MDELDQVITTLPYCCLTSSCPCGDNAALYEGSVWSGTDCASESDSGTEIF